MNFPYDSELAQLSVFLTSLGIGLLIGLERERSPYAKAGLRTFALVALFGTIAAMLAEKTGSPWLLVFGMAAVGALIVAAYVGAPAQENDPGTTTEAALLICYGLGAMVWYDNQMLAIMLAIITTILLYFKPELHGWSQRLTRRDLVSMLQFAVLSFIILPILPNQDYGPHNAINPHQVWVMVVLISGISLAGYVALRLFSHRYGAVLLGLLGGMVSSTATTMIYARYSKTSAEMDTLAASVILLANLVVTLRLAVLGAVVAPAILPQLLPVLGGAFALGLMVTLLQWRRLPTHEALPVPEITNPTEIRTALGFGALYAIVLFCSAWLTDYAGNKGLYTVAAVSGLTDVDAITLSSLRLFELGKLQPTPVAAAITLALLANMLFKLGLVLFISGPALAKRCAAGMLAVAAGAGAAFYFI